MSGTNAPPRGRSLWRLTLVLCAVLASAVVLAACGGDDDEEPATGGGGGASSGESTPAADKPTGEPIKTMTVAAVNWNGPQYPNILETAEMYEKYVNDRGGIAGRPLDVTVCDEMGDPNQLATCGRKAVSDGVVAVVGSFTLTGDRIVPILEEADTAWFGICCVISPAEGNSPITFNFGPQAIAGAAYSQKAIDLGCKKVAAVVIDFPGKNVFFDAQERVLDKAGIELAAKVAIPLASQDYAPQVAQATGNGVDCIVGGLAESNWASFLPAFAQSGSEAKIIGLQGNFDEKVAEPFASVVAGDAVIGYYPNITDPAFEDYRGALEQYKPDPSLDYNSLGGLGTWTAYVGFKNIVEKMSGEINAKTFLDAANKTTALDTGGKLPVLDLSTPWEEQPFGYERLFNTSVTYLKYGDDGKIVVDKPGFVDIKENALLAAGINK